MNQCKNLKILITANKQLSNANIQTDSQRDIILLSRLKEFDSVEYFFSSLSKEKVYMKDIIELIRNKPCQCFESLLGTKGITISRYLSKNKGISKIEAE